LPPRLFRVILPVSDIEKAAKFYSALLNISGKRVSSGRHYFDCGGTILACFDPKADGDDFELGPNPDHIYFAVNDLQQKFAIARDALGVSPDEIRVRPWGERSFYFKDPFGNKICFVDERTMFTG
jgi:catechol 2,3-dioxygenase-like lactoylglutathione lyase family enzyme